MSILISLCGPDGVGKTTLYRFLERVFYVKTNRYVVDYIWLRSPHTFAYLIYKLFIKMGFQGPILRNNISKSIWLYIEFISIIPKLLVVLTKLKFSRRVLIAERYLLDTIVTIITYFVKDIRYLCSLPMRFLLLLSFKYSVNKKTVFIYLDASEETIIKRRLLRLSNTDKHLLNPLSRKRVKRYISIQRKLYSTLITFLRGHKLDTSNKKPVEVLFEILTILHSVYRGNTDIFAFQ